MRFGLGIAFQPLAHGLAQMIERGFEERRQAPALLTFPARRAPPAVHALTDCA